MIPHFRAWVKKEKRMYVVLAIDFHFNHDITVSRGQSSCDVFQIPFKDVILLQSTGLKDKNGKEIWEGDIIRWIIKKQSKGSRHKTMQSETGEVHNVVGSCFCNLSRWSDKFNPEVIGNIWENKELLK